MEVELQNWSLNLNFEFFPWISILNIKFKLKSDITVWSSSLKLKFEVEVGVQSLRLKFQVDVWGWSLKIVVLSLWLLFEFCRSSSKIMFKVDTQRLKV